MSFKNRFHFHPFIHPSHPLLMPALFAMYGPIPSVPYFEVWTPSGLSNWFHGSVVSWLWSGSCFNNHYRHCRVVRIAIQQQLVKKRREKRKKKKKRGRKMVLYHENHPIMNQHCINCWTCFLKFTFPFCGWINSNWKWEGKKINKKKEEEKNVMGSSSH